MANNQTYFSRQIDKELRKWTDETNRKPLILRGARQVGKSSAVRELGKRFKYFVEVNFDENKEVKKLFEQSFTPQEICQRLAFLYGTPIIPGESLLFLDEIQSCVSAISRLRYFKEKYSALHVIAAGSLLELAIDETPSIGVGRERNLFMYPFSFEEFMNALGEKMLVEAYRSASPANPLFEPIHKKLLNSLKIFLIIGGLPEVVSNYVHSRDLLKCQASLNDLVITFRRDFNKYKQKVPGSRIAEVFQSVADQVNGKFIYEKAAIGANNYQVRQALDLLIKAGLVIPVTHTAANGIPLAAEKNNKYRRMLMCDTGIYQRVLGLDTTELLLSDDFKVVNRGAIAEMFVGLEIIKSISSYEEAELYCWVREKRNSQAQVDFVIQKGEKIIPIEVKSGAQGSMQSLREFMKEKEAKTGIRTSLENFFQIENINSYPLYAISNLLI